MKKIYFILIILSNASLFSQSSFNSESFRVTLGDLETNSFEKDSTATALVIYEEGNSYVDPSDYDLRTEVKHKIKILKKEGFNKATISIHLYNNKNTSERVKNIIATTYNKEGNEVIQTKLEKENIFTEVYDENHTLAKFTLPNIKEGSVITYSYTLFSHFMFNYKGWDFQDDIPKLYSEYRTSIPGNWLYNIKRVGYRPLDISTSDLKKNCLDGPRDSSADCSINRYAMKDIPAFIEEDNMTAKSNYLARVEYELKTFQGFDGVKNDYTKTWESVDDELRTDPNIGKQLGKSIKPEDFFDTAILNEKDLLKKAKAMYTFVQENYTWNDKYSLFKDASIKDLIKDRSGNVSSINMLLHNLLEESGIEVSPILLSTRNNGFATKLFPVISEFNYLIVQAKINDKTYLLDATDKYLSFGDIPFQCLNGYGRILDFKNGSNWVDIEPEKLSSTQYKVELNIGAEANMTGNVYAKNTGYHALNSRKAYYPNKNSYINNIHDENPNLEISNHEVISEGQTSSDFIETYDVEYEDNVVGDNIYLNPFIIKFFNENPFKLQERTYPIDFGYKDSYYFAFKLNFSNNYTLQEKPKDVNLVLPNKKGQIILSSNMIANSLVLTFKVDFKEAVYEPEYYPYLKEFMNKIVDIQTNSLILIKKK
ncbi:DUF3857 domain-containing protein [Mariniflexile sp. AS56]|uniref:DUF3857 domain-containing protein n=1 Tax=Mariniflexile sp. AS56 TaxID=3063957 RepID=UPI0026F1CCFC|nr:DUF3857 domain-containing protein [Mariniflexile sp. AS56]MDO7172771.1 DUF3857 domain-containing protein [Mariniflexile sp. AS56]